MKLSLSLLAFLLTVCICNGQNTPEPEFKNTVALLKDNVLTGLERVSPDYVSKMKGLGYGGVDLLFTVDGAASSVRIAGANPQFVFKALDADTDPSLILKLIKVDVKKNKRVSKQGNANMTGSSMTPQNTISVNVKKIKPGVYMVSPQTGTLVKGEYALQVPLNYQAQASVTGNSNCLWFAFGVD